MWWQTTVRGWFDKGVDGCSAGDGAVVFYKKLGLKPGEQRLWLWMAVFALACVPLVIISSTAVDRVALYFIPLQLFLFTRLPGWEEHPIEEPLSFCQ